MSADFVDFRRDKFQNAGSLAAFPRLYTGPRSWPVGRDGWARFAPARRPHADRERAAELRDGLGAQGLQVWIDDREIETFASITRAIEQGLAQSRGCCSRSIRTGTRSGGRAGGS